MNDSKYHKQLDDYVIGMLTPAERTEFERHLRGCERCQQELEKYDRVSAKISSMPKGIPPTRDLWQDVETRLTESAIPPADVEKPKAGKPNESAARNVFRLQFNWYLRAAAVALILLGAAGVWMLMKNLTTQRTAGRPDIFTNSNSPETSAGHRSPIDSSRHGSIGTLQPGNPVAAIRSRPDQFATGSSRAEAPAAKPTVPFVEFLRASFTNYTDHFPNDRVYLQLDKPFYNPGETIWFQAYLRNEMDLLPSRQSDILHVELIEPKGKVSQQRTLFVKDGSASGDFELNENLPGGIYKVKAYTQWQNNFADPYLFEKEIQVQNVVLPRLKMKLEFERKAFGAGDVVLAKFEASTLENKPLADVNFKCVGKINDTTIAEQMEKTDRLGKAYVSFELPKDLSSIDGILGILVQHEGQIESISRSIPIVLNNIRFAMYPEGGDLVNGLKSSVAFQALNEFDKPADVEGIVVDNFNRQVTTFTSYHQGLGSFTITPEKGNSYRARITKPEGIATTFDLPNALTHGQTLGVRHTANGKISFVVGSTVDEKMSIVAQVRGKLCFTKYFAARAGTTSIQFPTNHVPAGVVQATLFDRDGIEQAERLFFINKHDVLKVEISTNKQRYEPREKVTLTLRATDSRGKPAAGKFSLAVVDDKLISFADDKSGNILSKMLLEPDLRGKVEEPGFYFDPKEPKADKALDYLLMTRGWRRFVWKQILVDKLPEVQYPGERARIAGVVLDRSTGNPVPDAVVSIEGDSNFVSHTDAEGKFTLKYPDLTKPVVVTASKSTFARCRKTVRDYTENLRCALWKPGSTVTIAGKVTDIRTGHPVAGASVRMKSASRQFTRTDANGEFSIQYQYLHSSDTLRVDANGYFMSQAILPSQKDTLQVQLFKSGNTGLITGRVTDAKTGEPIPGVNMQVVGTTRGANTDFEGEYTIIAVPFGEYTLRASMVGYKEAAVQHLQIPATNADFSLAECAVYSAGIVTADQRIVHPLTTTSTQTVDTRVIRSTSNDAISIKQPADATAVHANAVPNQTPPINVLAEAKLTVEKDRAGGRELNAQLGANKAMLMIPREPPGGFARFYRAREFPAPVYASGEAPEDRTDFRSTIFWKGDISPDKSGKAVITFYNSDEVTSFRITVEGISNSGIVGRAEKTYFTQLPFSLAAKVPAEVSMGDTVRVPLTLTNTTGHEIVGRLTLRPPKSWKQISFARPPQVIAPGAAKTMYIPFEVLDTPGKDMFEAAFDGEGFHDAFQHEVVVREKGFPRSVSFSGDEKQSTYGFRISNAIPKTVYAKLTVYPSVTSDLLAGIEGMFQEPGGCFEQASSRNYPNVIALRYLEEHNVRNAELMSRVTRLLDDGYKRLTGYETKQNGYEWFGATPPHEALTSYGLMEFKDMEPVYASVDKAMVDRTAHWLMGRKDGKGGFLRSTRSVDSFGRASAEITNAYIVYSLAEAGYTDIKPELDNAYEKAMESQDPYQLALVAIAQYDLKDYDRASAILKELLKAQLADGSWCGKTNSITMSSGASLKIETTALSAMALLKAGSPAPDALSKAVRFILSSRSGHGGFGSTQSTVLALKALTQFAELSRRTGEAGTVLVSLDGKEIARKSYSASEQDAIVLDSLQQFLPEDGTEHHIDVTMNDVKHPLPHSMLVSWTADLPPTSDSAKVRIETRLTHSWVHMGETVRLNTILKNITPDGLPMTIAVIGIAGGLSPQPWQLKELQERNVFDYYEIIGRHIAVYYRRMKPGEIREINLDLKAEIPGRYDSPASSSYLYYTNEYKSWSAAGPVEITVP